MTDTDWIDGYMAELHRRELSTATRVAYMAALRAFAVWMRGAYNEPFQISNIVAHDVKSYKAHLVTLQRSPATINQHLAALASVTRWAVGAGLLRDDPCVGICGAKSQAQAPRALDQSDLKKLERAVHHGKNAMHIAIIELMVGAGLRVSEVCDLSIDDVEIKPRSGRVTIRNGKGNKTRTVPLNQDVRTALTAWLDKRPSRSTRIMFIGERGALTTGGAWWIVKRYAEQAGVECSPHVLRHTFATRLVREQGVDLVTVQDLLGHDNVNTTARYARSTEADQQAAVDRL